MIELKKAIPRDAPLLRACRIAAFDWELTTYGFVADGYDTMENILSLIVKKTVYKISYKGRTVGGICIHRRGMGRYLIGPLFIHPAFHNKGIGTYVMLAVEKFLPDKKVIELNTAYKNFKNHHFYEKLGYVKIGEFPPNTTGFRLFLYEKHFAPQKKPE